MVFEFRIRAFALSVIADSHQQNIPFVVLEPTGVLLPFYLSKRRVNDLIDLQLDQQSRLIRIGRSRETGDVCIPFPAVQFQDDGVILLCGIVGKLNGVTQGGFVMIRFIAGLVVCSLQERGNFVSVLIPGGFQQVQGGFKGFEGTDIPVYL